MRVRAAGAVALLLLAGCLGGDEAANGTPPDDVEDDGGADDARPTPPAPSRDAPYHVTRYLNAGMQYDVVAPPAGEPQRVPLPAFVPFAVTGGELPWWTGRGDHATVFVTELTVVFFYGQDTPGQSDANFPPFGAMWGARDGMIGFSFGDGPDMILPGEVLEARIEMPLPESGLLLREGIPSVTSIFGLYHPTVEGVAEGYALVGSADTPSRIEITAQNATLPATLERQLLAESGEVSGSTCFGTETETAVRAYSFDVPATAIGLRVELTRTGGQGQEDLDLNVLGPDGSARVGGHTPFGHEIVEVFAPGFGPLDAGAWQAVVNACGAQAAEFEVVVTALLPVDATSPD